MMDDLPFRARAIWDSDCGIVLLDGQRQVVSVIVRRSYSSMVVVQGISLYMQRGPGYHGTCELNHIEGHGHMGIENITNFQDQSCFG